VGPEEELVDAEIPPQGVFSERERRDQDDEEAEDVSDAAAARGRADPQAGAS